jgi:hypothetical protein
LAIPIRQARGEIVYALIDRRRKVQVGRRFGLLAQGRAGGRR